MRALVADQFLFPVSRCWCARSHWTWSFSFWQHFWTVLPSLSVSLRLFWRNDSADLWALCLRKRLEMPSNDVRLLWYRPRSDLQPSVNIRRAVSEDCLLGERGLRLENYPRPGFSMLKLSKTRISVGDSITVYWDIREQCGANDWIGLFDLGKCTCIPCGLTPWFLPASQRNQNNV